MRGNSILENDALRDAAINGRNGLGRITLFANGNSQQQDDDGNYQGYQNSRYVIAGHLHPAVTLHGPGRDHLRLACFSFDAGCAVLPAFGEFTGGWKVERQPGRALYAVGGQAVWRVPA